MDNFKNSANLSGLTVKNGRLINDRPNISIAGVTAACIARKELKNAEKLEAEIYTNIMENALNSNILEMLIEKLLELFILHNNSQIMHILVFIEKI
jgi:phosphopantothenate synthetase